MGTTQWEGREQGTLVTAKRKVEVCSLHLAFVTGIGGEGVRGWGDEGVGRVFFPLGFEWSSYCLKGFCPAAPLLIFAKSRLSLGPVFIVISIEVSWLPSLVWNI